jgi:hypothetical protein
MYASKALGEYLREVREATGHGPTGKQTQADVAHWMVDIGWESCSRKVIGAIETGKRSISVDEWDLFAQWVSEFQWQRTLPMRAMYPVGKFMQEVDVQNKVGQTPLVVDPDTGAVLLVADLVEAFRHVRDDRDRMARKEIERVEEEKKLEAAAAAELIRFFPEGDADMAGESIVGTMERIILKASSLTAASGGRPESRALFTATTKLEEALLWLREADRIADYQPVVLWQSEKPMTDEEAAQIKAQMLAVSDPRFSDSPTEEV